MSRLGRDAGRVLVSHPAAGMAPFTGSDTRPERAVYNQSIMAVDVPDVHGAHARGRLPWIES